MVNQVIETVHAQDVIFRQLKQYFAVPLERPVSRSRLSSVSPAIASRACLLMPAKVVSKSACLSTLGNDAPAISISGVWITLRVKPGSVAIWPASHPSVPDLACGFQSHFAAGTRSRVFRVLGISTSNSRSSSSLRGIRILLIDLAEVNPGK